jgi:hypothetical protein
MIAAALTTLLLVTGALEEQPDFVAGQAFYADLEFEQAIVKFRFALGDPALTKPEQAQVLMWIAVTSGQMGDNNAARQAYRDAFVLDADGELPPITPPTLIPLANEERAAAKQKLEERAAAEAAAEAVEAEAAAHAAAERAAAEQAPDAPLADDAVASPEEPNGLPWLTISGGSAAAVGGLFVLGAAAALAWGVNSYLFATDATNFQSDADGAVFQMNLAWVAAGGLGVAALGLVGAGASLAAVDLVLE